MKLGIIITGSDPETVWNAYRLGNYTLSKGDNVRVFLLGKGVESGAEDPKYDIKKQIENFIKNNGEILACGACMKSRKMESSKTCPLSSMEDLYQIIKKSEKVITF